MYQKHKYKIDSVTGKLIDGDCNIEWDCKSCEKLKEIMLKILKTPRVKFELIKDQLIKELENL